ncbi:MAG TPA: zinc-dependent alcohol dehydrogenase family protein [Thermoanaerobaculia bacterium]|nr:zinc-dependent alcohol dehydrogenase family protein [Thermoanaerobaculia bacterium]HEV8610391.1 zinc-dependent alcohol dehydrogenase family protein [Thermoanaerobaculia bacterium]
MLLERAGPAERNPLRAAELPDPRPAAGEIVVEVDACGVCRTDLHIVEGEVGARLPIVLGHQVAGRVVECGPGVEGIARGDLVGVGWVSATCGECAFCVSGRENLCRRAVFTGRDRNGGYAERMTAPKTASYRLPAGFTARQAAPLLCAGVIGYRTLRLSGARPGSRLGLFGFGASAHLVLQVARHERCEVYVFTRQERHRELAREMGAAWAGATAEDPGVLLDAAAIFAPAGEVVPIALERLDRGATLAVNAIHMTPIPALDYAKLYGERVVRSVMSSTRRDAEEFLELAGRIPIRAETVLFGLEQAGEALVRIKRGEIRGAAVLTVRD